MISTQDFLLIWFQICRDKELVKKIGAATAVEVRATGINYAFAPCIAVYIIFNIPF